MNKDFELISKKNEPQSENYCPCNCIDQVDKNSTGNPLVKEKVNKKNSCC
ncbi:MAG: hypothetical protein ACFFKA_03735 [Candidatus Thorarchaeota archaeon]